MRTLFTEGMDQDSQGLLSYRCHVSRPLLPFLHWLNVHLFYTLYQWYWYQVHCACEHMVAQQDIF